MGKLLTNAELCEYLGGGSGAKSGGVKSGGAESGGAASDEAESDGVGSEGGGGGDDEPSLLGLTMHDLEASSHSDKKACKIYLSKIFWTNLLINLILTVQSYVF